MPPSPTNQEPPQQAVSQQAIFKQAFWLLGVIVGLSMKEGLSVLFPHALVSNADGWERAEEMIRCLVFVILIIRFYLGAVLFFEEAYFSAVTSERYPVKNFMMDILFGLVHFIFFFILARSIEIHDSNAPMPQYMFLAVLSIILLYDLVWFFASKGYNTRDLMKMWTVINTATFCLCILVYYICRSRRIGNLTTESLSLAPVVIVSAVDVVQIIASKEFFTKWIYKVIERIVDFLPKPK